MTYLGFHAVFIIPCIALLIVDAVRRRSVRDRTIYQGIGVIVCLAVLYATPWDNWLVREGIWTYAPSAVIATIGYVPVEEYLFFVLQPILTGLWLRSALIRRRESWADPKRPQIVVAGVVGWLGVGVASGLLLMFAGTGWRYMGMIGIWVAPILAFQWAVGGAQLWANRGIWALGVLPPTLYLSAVDRIAIGAGVWHITPETSTGAFVFGLPVEEFLFFLLTNIMIVQGVFLFVWVKETGRLAAVARWLTIETPPHTLAISDSAYRTIQRIVIRPALALLALIAVVFLLPVQLPLEAQLVPFLLSAVLLGLPHGAVDHLVPGLIARKPLSLCRMGALLVGYIALVGAVIGLWMLSPVVGFVFFIALTWWHWGTADLHATLAFHRAAFLDTRLKRALTAFVRGGLPMFVPLLFSPQDYRLALDSLAALFASADVRALDGFFAEPFRVVGGVAFAGAVALNLIVTMPGGLYQRYRAEWAVFAGEIALLSVFFALVPPFLSIGLYFCLWHAARHITRLILLDPAVPVDGIGGAQFAAGFWRFTLRATPLTLISLVFLAGLYLAVPASPESLLSLIALYLVLISGLTLPHSVVVLWMDRAQGVWRIAPQPSLRASENRQQAYGNPWNKYPAKPETDH